MIMDKPFEMKLSNVVIFLSSIYWKSPYLLIFYIKSFFDFFHEVLDLCWSKLHYNSSWKYRYQGLSCLFGFGCLQKFCYDDSTTFLFNFIQPYPEIVVVNWILREITSSKKKERSLSYRITLHGSFTWSWDLNLCFSMSD